MRRIDLRLICVLVCLAVAIPVVAQPQRGAADPLTGVWAGDWGPNAGDRNRVEVDLKVNGKAVSGTVKSIQPQRADVALQMSTFDAATGNIHMEADATSPRGGAPVRFIIDGKLASGVITGTWNHGATKGDFRITKK